MIKTRINPTTGQEEWYNQPEGLPGIWMTRGYCARCKPFNECLGFRGLTDGEWDEVETLISETNNLASLKNKIEDITGLKKCV